jgi:neopullulanase
MLETHDTPRFITQAGGDWYRARPAAIFQMTYQGAPSIYYGAEIGMEGAADPDSRRAYDWKLAEGVRPVRQLDGAQPEQVTPQRRASELFGLYQKLIETRKGSEALRRGEFEVLTTHNADQTIAYRRWVPGSDAQDAVVAINNNVVGREVEVPVGAFAKDGAAYVDALTGARFEVRDGTLDLGQVDGNWGAVLLREG